MNHDLMIAISILLLYVLGALQQAQFRYVHRRINMMAHRRAAVRRSKTVTLVRDGSSALAESMRRHPAGKKLRAVK